MLKTTFAIAAISFASAATAGNLVAPGWTQSVTGTLVALPGVSQAIAEVSGTDTSGPIALPITLNPTQIENIAKMYGATYVEGQPMTVPKATIRLADGKEKDFSLTIDSARRVTLTPL